MRSSIRYTLARITLFLVCLLAGWLLGLRDNPLLLVLAAATVSMFVSIVALRGMREEFSRDVAARVEARVRRRRQEGPADVAGGDEEVEDRLVDGQGQDAFVADDRDGGRRTE